MISGDFLKKVSLAFCGDDYNLYTYKKGPKLVSFFNEYFGTKDTYGSGFPSRWVYVYDKLTNLQNINKLPVFFDIILSNSYLLREDNNQTAVDIEKRREKTIAVFNSFFKQDMCKLCKTSDGSFRILLESDDLDPIGNGGFANVYFQKSTGKVVKKLKNDFLTNDSIVSRFKREFSITKGLQDLEGIICVYDYNDENCSYSMEKAELTLEKYLSNRINENQRIKCVQQILSIMDSVHRRDVIHRDLSPNNILIIKGKLFIADFGLGKDLNVFTSHQTMDTNSLGQFWYCAPEQFMLLKEGDKRSDVYSLGRIINYIFTGNPRNTNHTFGYVTEKATNDEASYRYQDAIELKKDFDKVLAYYRNQQSEDVYDSMINNGSPLTDELAFYISNLSGRKLCEKINTIY